MTNLNSTENILEEEFDNEEDDLAVAELKIGNQEYRILIEAFFPFFKRKEMLARIAQKLQVSEQNVLEALQANPRTAEWMWQAKKFSEGIQSLREDGDNGWSQAAQATSFVHEQVDDEFGLREEMNRLIQDEISYHLNNYGGEDEEIEED